MLTSNQPRHLSLVRALATVADEICAVLECNTLFPGRVDDFFRRSEVMRAYFSHVMAAEAEVFGPPGFSPPNVRVMAMKLGDLSRVDPAALAPVLEADLIVVFGASYIRGPLVEALVEHRAVNIHMGVSPYYRGSSCNFWALRDGRPDLVGATVHLLSSGLDSGAMLFHALPLARAEDPFVLGMRAVLAAHQGLVSAVADGSLRTMTPVQQDRTRELRYTRNVDFTDEMAAEYLESTPSPMDVARALDARDMSLFLRPRVGGEGA